MNKVLVSIRQQILLAFVLLALTGVASSLWNTVLLFDHEARLAQLDEESLPTLVAAYEISRQGESITKAASSLIRTPDKWRREAFINRIADQFNWIDTQLGVLSELGYSEDRLNPIRQNKQALQKSFSELVQVIETSHQNAEIKSAQTVTQAEDKIERQLLQHKYRADLMTFSVATLTNEVSDEIKRLISDAHDNIHNEVWLLTAYSIGATLFAVLVVVYLDTHIGRRVVAVQRAMRAVADGKKGEEIPHGGNDEISDMGGALRTFVDKLEERENVLRELVERAEKANHDKSVFLAAASHDMRQPLQAMNLFLYALKSGQGQPVDNKVIGHLEQSTASLGQILDRLLDLSRLEAGVINIKKQTFPLHTMFERLVEEFRPAAVDRGLRLNFVPSSLGVHSDPILLENILRNLIANAIKYTNAGRVLLGCRRLGKGDVQIQVWDTGNGIAKDQQSKIFDEFCQLGVNPGNAVRGLGLGLSIVHRVATLLDHKLGLRSEPGLGSMFSITVPLERRLAIRGDRLGVTEKPAAPKDLSIIVVDDEELVRTSLTLMLSAADFHVTSIPCIDCPDDIAKLDFPQNIPDIIIADYRLANNKTGVEAISNLCEFFDKEIPAILLTGDTAPHRLKEISESGYSLLHKPVDGDDLLLHIQDILSQELTIKG
ncbi:ATP-binding protein [Pseudomonadota bacterium]